MRELTELKEVIQILIMEIKVFNETLREQNLRSGKLGKDNENKVLKELREKKILYKNEIIRILGVSANSAQNIMQRISQRGETIRYIPGCGSNSSKLISLEDPLVKKADELLKLIPLHCSLSREEIFAKLEIDESDFSDVLRITGMLGGKFRWVDTNEVRWISGEEIKKRVMQRVG